MLVLTRRDGEEVRVTHPMAPGGYITVRVAAIRGDRVRLAFDAPTSISVHRAEVHERIAEENRAAARLKLPVGNGVGVRP